METFTIFLRQIAQVFAWWVMVAPWEQAIRVRAGKRVRLLGAGCHLRVPFLDVVHVQSVRLRVAHLPMQTVMTKDRKALTVAGSLGYAIHDIKLLYETLHHGQDTLTNLATMALAEQAALLVADELTPHGLSQVATESVGFERFGLSDVKIRITDFAFLRTYRLVSDARWGGHGDALNTEKKQP